MPIHCNIDFVVCGHMYTQAFLTGPARGAHGSQCLVAARCKTRLEFPQSVARRFQRLTAAAARRNTDSTTREWPWHSTVSPDLTNRSPKSAIVARARFDVSATARRASPLQLGLYCTEVRRLSALGLHHGAVEVCKYFHAHLKSAFRLGKCSLSARATQELHNGSL
jgi:hypothetical protein